MLLLVLLCAFTLLLMPLVVVVITVSEELRKLPDQARGMPDANASHAAVSPRTTPRAPRWQRLWWHWQDQYRRAARTFPLVAPTRGSIRTPLFRLVSVPRREWPREEMLHLESLTTEMEAARHVISYCDRILMGVILANALLLGLEYYGMPSSQKVVLDWINYAISVVFLVECIIKQIGAHGLRCVPRRVSVLSLHVHLFNPCFHFCLQRVQRSVHFPTSRMRSTVSTPSLFSVPSLT